MRGSRVPYQAGREKKTGARPDGARPGSKPVIQAGLFALAATVFAAAACFSAALLFIFTHIKAP